MKMWKALAASALAAVMLAAAAAPAQQAPNEAPEAETPAEAGKYRLETSELVVLASYVAPKAGEERVIRKYDKVFQAPIGWELAGALKEPLETEVSGMKIWVKAGAKLVSAKVTGGDAASLPADAQVLCASGEWLRRWGMKKFKVGGKVVARYDAITQFCLVDLDNDRRMDKMFLSGTKLPQDWQMTDTPAPLPYDLARNVPINKSSYLEVTYDDGSWMSSPSLNVSLNFSGGATGLNWIRFDERDSKRVGSVSIDPKLPFPRIVTIGNSQIEVTAIDTAAKTATIRYERDFSPQRFWYSVYVPTTVYYYYYW